MKVNAPSLPADRIHALIIIIRGQRVLLDRDLAVLYGVETKALNQAVRRNRDRFPSDFIFRLTTEEVVDLNRSQFVTGLRNSSDTALRAAPKGAKWKMRARLGERVRWYEEPEEART